MKKLNLLIPFFLVLFSSAILAQSDSGFSLETYQQFLNSNQNLSFEELVEMYPATDFVSGAPSTFSNALFADSVYKYYQFTEDEIDVMERNGFMVSDRIRYKSFGEAFMSIYKRDLPVYISSDAILHAIHMSYSNILSTLEEEVLFNSLDTLLSSLHNQLGELDDTYGDSPIMETSLKDLDVYLSVPRILLGNNVDLYYASNQERVDTVLYFIDKESLFRYPLFSKVPRDLDFSQFTVRGHYTQSEKLSKYFQAMMWLGRTELYLIVPESIKYNGLSQAEKDSIGQRQTITSYLIEEAFLNESTSDSFREIDDIISFFVGESDNVLLDHLKYLKQIVNFEDVSALADLEVYKSFRDALINEPFADQSILSQVLVQDPLSPEGIKPASAFLLLGQRFIIDSYILGNVVFDNIPNNVKRMLPESADAMFALGNDDALALLERDLKEYGYSLNLAGLRYLIDSYEQEYWEATFFNLWLEAIRQLSPPQERTTLPLFAQTKAWSDKTLNTQMAAWAQIRHDNLLYAKQSYTGGPVCEFPYSYVEPNPDFFDAMANLAVVSRVRFSELSAIPPHYKSYIDRYFEGVENVNKQLSQIAEKQLEGIELSDDEILFLQEMMHEDFVGCVTEITGWYKDLFFNGEVDLLKEDFIVADVHTSPFNEQGVIVGWVKHIGTGPLNLATIVTELADGQNYVFVGPVMSYYEHTSINFKRLTDEEWVQTFEVDPIALRPEFTESFVVSNGEFYYDTRDFIPTSSDSDQKPDIPQTIELSQNYPNPFNAGTMIGFRIPVVHSGKLVKLEIFNVQGQLIETLVNTDLTSGNYSIRWNSEVASGTYFYRLTVGSETQLNKMLLVK